MEIKQTHNSTKSVSCTSEEDASDVPVLPFSTLKKIVIPQIRRYDAEEIMNFQNKADAYLKELRISVLLLIGSIGLFLWHKFFIILCICFTYNIVVTNIARNKILEKLGIGFIETKNESKVCPICKKNTIMGNTHCCDHCRNIVISNIRGNVKSIERLVTQATKDFKNYEPYITRFKILIENINRPEYLYQMIGYTYEIRYDEIEYLLSDKLSSITNLKLEEVSLKHPDDEKRYQTHVNKLVNELVYLSVAYPLFKPIIEQEMNRVIELNTIQNSAEPKSS